jgi:hypothetical protein
MELVALLNGKAVTYPMNATFIIEHRIAPRKWGNVSSKPTINAALTKFYRLKRKGEPVRLMSACEGRVKRLL